MKADYFLCRIFVRSLLTLNMLILGHVMTVPATHAAVFGATGPRTPTQLNTNYYPGLVTVTFDLLPTTMSFDLPQYFCMVTENGIKFAPLGAQTYDPRNGDTTLWGPGRDSTCRYATAWIDRTNAARIVVRARYALTDSNTNIAHSDIASGSPYGAGDWADEWWYIYPDGTCLRDVKLYTGLAGMSLPYGTFPKVPNVTHQFMTACVIGPQGHVPTDDINTNALTLGKTWGNATAQVIALGTNTTISYSPYSADFGAWRDCNYMLINSKSTYKPFVIGLPYGMRTEPFSLATNSTSPLFQTWTNYYSVPGYVSALGRMINYWQFRAYDKTLEQVYLMGMTTNSSLAGDLIKLGWTWILAAEEETGTPRNYLQFTYDQAQKAYVLANNTPQHRNFQLMSWYKIDNLTNTMWLVNPAIVVSNWNVGVSLYVSWPGNSNLLAQGTDYRVGYETNGIGKTNMVLWLNKTYNLYTNADNAITVDLYTN